MDTWNDQDWLDGVRRWYYGGQPPAADRDAEPSQSVAIREPAVADAYALMIEAACARAALERQGNRTGS